MSHLDNFMSPVYRKMRSRVLVLSKFPEFFDGILFAGTQRNTVTVELEVQKCGRLLSFLL